MMVKNAWYEEMINNRNKSVVKDMKWSPDGMILNYSIKRIKSLHNLRGRRGYRWRSRWNPYLGKRV